jgi:hypothetical protein
MRKTLFILFLLCVFTAADVFAQLPDANPTRPSASDNAFMTAPGYLEVETGLLLSDGFYSIPTLLKASLVKDMEFGFLMSGLINHRSKPVTTTDVGDPGFQAKYQFLRDSNTTISAVARLEFPDGGSRFTAYLVPTLTPFVGEFDATLGFSTWSGTTSLIYAAAFSPVMPSPIGVYGEFYGQSASNYAPFYFDAGASYKVSNDFVLDAAFGIGLNNDAADWQFQVGLTKVLAKVL